MKATLHATLLLAALLAPAAADAHRVVVEVDRREGAVAARARYGGGRPLAGARYEVVSPAQPERAFAEGLTDRHGWLVFVPDAPGTWRVRIADASGHGHVAAVEVPPPRARAADAPNAAAPDATAASSASPAAGEPSSEVQSDDAHSRATGVSLVRVGAGVGVIALVFLGLSTALRRRTSAGR